MTAGRMVGGGHWGFIDLHHFSHTPYKKDGSPGGGRAIKPNDERHNGLTTVNFFDGHAEKRDLTDPDEWPYQMWQLKDGE